MDECVDEDDDDEDFGDGDESNQRPNLTEFTFENKWTSGPLKQFSASPEAFYNQFKSILTVEIIKQKKQCLNLDWLLFEVEEFAKAGELARKIMQDYVSYNKEM
jgi:hypothetical protein